MNTLEALAVARLKKPMLGAEAARLLGLEPATVRSWQHRGHIHPCSVDTKGRPLYKFADVLACRDARDPRFKNRPSEGSASGVRPEKALKAAATSPALDLSRWGDLAERSPNNCDGLFDSLLQGVACYLETKDRVAQLPKSQDWNIGRISGTREPGVPINVDAVDAMRAWEGRMRSVYSRALEMRRELDEGASVPTSPVYNDVVGRFREAAGLNLDWRAVPDDEFADRIRQATKDLEQLSDQLECAIGHTVGEQKREHDVDSEPLEVMVKRLRAAEADLERFERGFADYMRRLKKLKGRQQGA